MKTTAMAAGLAVMLLASTAPYALGQEAPKPSVINSTYTVSDSSGSSTYELREEGDTLTLYRKAVPLSSIEYAKVKYIPIKLFILCAIARSDGNTAIFTLRSNVEAKAVAEYIAHRAGLELVVDTWRVRRPFQCPEGVPGCFDFKELLDHDDPEIVGYFYHLDQANLATFACFSGDEGRFFILQYYIPYLQSSGSRFFHKAFKNGQENSSTLEYLRWHGDVGEITDSPTRKRQTLVWIDASSLSFHNKFTNKISTTTDYTLNVRWATGRYTETYLSKDERGKIVTSDSSGTCVKLDEPGPMQIPKGATLAEPTKP